MTSKASEIPIRTHYDYIIVGGGTSGLVVAKRLSADQKLAILVIEAGADRTDDPRVFTPGLMNDMYGNADFEWLISGVPQPQLNGRTLVHPVGRTWGGSSAINMCCVVYPSRANFDSWAALGNTGWDWNAMSPYLQKFSSVEPPSEETCGQLSLPATGRSLGGEGPIHVSYARSYLPCHRAWVPTFENLNQPPHGDHVSGTFSGPFLAGVTIDPETKRRSHAGADYCSPRATHRSNIAALTEAQVQRVMLKREQNGSVSAVGVVIRTKNGMGHKIYARREVVLAAGSFKTPQLLELSGIGNASLLRAHRIDVFIDNKNVGENLQDHGLVPCSWELADGQVSGDMMKDPGIMAEAISAYEQSKDGPLAEFPFMSSYLNLQLPKESINRIRNHMSVHGYLPPGNNKQQDELYGILDNTDEPIGQCSLVPRQLKSGDDSTARYMFGFDEEGQYITFCGVLNHPFSRGSTHIHSNDPNLNPTVDIGFLRHPLDLELHAHILLFVERLASTEPMASLLKPMGRRLHLEGGKKSMDSLRDAKHVAKQKIVSNNHPCGTCAMLPMEQGGVVNSRLLVHGTNNLRIVDASVFPLIPRGNIQSTVYAVAERAADLILEDQRNAGSQEARL
ncbi:aryl-alcohol dehydrogenase [Colletotrichum karsti]|uniref:Aryl-alcohol dehydrogenase n=1 Tax=Colletotrichum karsti TaxID=1095194 RepID=A0A9P6HZA9_9PEZI|nr:aryl-alcohol dehydrogenase [Colletotrichum karsti]KAF9872915.1 aryl-alcohol dehydrogenase [Colletotrichum karsti]